MRICILFKHASCHFSSSSTSHSSPNLTSHSYVAFVVFAIVVEDQILEVGTEAEIDVNTGPVTDAVPLLFATVTGTVVSTCPDTTVVVSPTLDSGFILLNCVTVYGWPSLQSVVVVSALLMPEDVSVATSLLILLASSRGRRRGRCVTGEVQDVAFAFKAGEMKALETALAWSVGVGAGASIGGGTVNRGRAREAEGRKAARERVKRRIVGAFMV